MEEDKREILFVDDEKNVLDGLKRMLRPMRKKINMTFAENAKEALEIMEKRHFDVIISDMRMPGMNGAELLREVKNLYPATMRIILTGQSAESAILQTIGVAHQFLDKPCEPERLKNIILRALFIKRLMAYPGIERIVSRIDTLPSLPEIYMEVRKKVADPESSTEDIGMCIEKDVAMSAKIMQLVNSAFFGHFKNVNTPSRAVSVLGLETINTLILSLHIFKQYEKMDNLAISMQSLWKHSLLTAKAAKAIAVSESENKTIHEEAFMAGMLHDIGKLVLAAGLPEKYKEIVQLCKDEKISCYESETRIFGVGHAEVGGYLLGLWGIPGPVMESITYHHRISIYPSNQFDGLTALYAADFFINKINPCENFQDITTELDEKHFISTGTIQNLKKWEMICRNEVEKHHE